MNAGDVLVHRYRLLDRLGVGGMSVVWRAHDEVLRRDVAVKVLAVDREHRAMPPDAIRTEAQAAAKLAHAHVANVFDFGEIVNGTGQTVPFIVMELLHGTTLAALIAEGRLDPESALLACAQVAAALAEAHAHGLVHRDVKPSNVMMTTGGAKVFDFGIAVPIGTLDAPGTDAPILGTPAYVAPERITGGEATPASDIYALGVLLYRVLTDEYPWPAGSASHLLYAHVYGHARDLPPMDGVPDSVHDLYRRCVAKDPAERPTAAEAAAVLAEAASTRPVSVPVSVPVSMPPAGSEDGTTRLGAVGPRRRKRWPVFAGLAGAAAAVAVVLSGMAGSSLPLPGDTPHQAGPMPSSGPNGGISPTATVPGEPGGAGATPGPGATGGPGGPTIAPTSPATLTSPEPTSGAGGPQTFVSDGGSVVAGCNGGTAYLQSWQAAAGYQGRQVMGPNPQAVVAFRRQTVEIRMTITCPDGVPTLTTTQQTVGTGSGQT